MCLKPSGRLTLRQYCDREGLNLETVIAKLNKNDVEAKPNTSIRKMAGAFGLHPSVIRDILGDCWEWVQRIDGDCNE